MLPSNQAACGDRTTHRIESSGRDNRDMVGMRERRGGRFTRNPYAQIFSIPGTWRFAAAGLIGRMQMSMYGLGTVLLIAASTGRYGMAGAVASAGALGSAFVAPQVARLADQ